MPLWVVLRIMQGARMAKHPQLCCLHQVSAAHAGLCLQEVDGIFPNKKIVNKMNEVMEPPLVSQVHIAG